MGWRVAKSLDVLLDEINTAAPNRSKASDGSIGDTRHQNSTSDHNPNAKGVVCARDFTHDPGDGADMHKISRTVVKTPPKALKYVIWNRQIWSVARASEGWRKYSGSNPHTKHMHVSVGTGADGHSTGPYDDTSSWGVADTGSTPEPSTPAKPSAPTNDKPKNDWTKELIMALPTLKRGSKGTDVKRVQGLLQANGYRSSNIDGDFGPKTEHDVKRFQQRYAKPADGIVGKVTWRALLGE